MVKLLVFAILLASSPATGLLETLFQTENSCYLGCHSNKAASKDHLEACKKGCDFKLLNEDCAAQCQSHSKDPEIRASCQVGCTLSRPVDEVVPEKPIAVVEPPPGNKDPVIVPLNLPLGRPRSIILIRLRNRPSMEMPSAPQFFNSDPVQMFNDIIRQFQEKANSFEQTVRKTLDQNSKDLPKPSEFGTISELTKNIPIIRLSGNMRADSSSESSEEFNGKRPLVDEFRHVLQHPRERMHPIRNRIHQFFTDVRTEWNDLVRKQPKIPIWIFLGILLSSSAILWYMIISLCRRTPGHHTLSVHAQELVFDNTDEKEKLPSNEEYYQITESVPIKVKLANM